MADGSVDGRRTTHRWCLVLLVTMSFVLAAFAPAARAEKFNLAPGQAHTSVSKPGTDGTERRRGGPVETITVPPGGSAVTATSFVQGQEYPVVARRSVGTTNADGSYAYDWFYLHECSPFPSQCEPFTGGIPEEYSRIWVSDKTRSNVPLTAFASGGQFAWPAYQEDHVYPLTITDADGRLTITDAFPSFGYSTAGETGSWKLDVFPSDAGSCSSRPLDVEFFATARAGSCPASVRFSFETRGHLPDKPDASDLPSGTEDLEAASEGTKLTLDPGLGYVGEGKIRLDVANSDDDESFIYLEVGAEAEYTRNGNLRRVDFDGNVDESTHPDCDDGTGFVGAFATKGERANLRLTFGPGCLSQKPILWKKAKKFRKASIKAGR